MSKTAPSFERTRSQRAYWICQLGGWGAYGVARFSIGILLVQIPWSRLAADIVILHGVGLGATHGLRWLATRNGWRALRWPQLTWRILVWSALAGVPVGVLTHYMAIDVLNDPSVAVPEGTLVGGFDVTTALRASFQMMNWAITFVAWFVAYFVIVRLRTQREAELRQSEIARALQLAELRLLKSQLNPHFLFNALNTVRSLIPHDPTRAQDAVTRLANTLRYTLNSTRDELVSFAQELEIVKDYLELEVTRFEERLRVEYEIAPEAQGLTMPVMLLQTVVENAIKHGIAALPDGGVVRIRASMRNGALSIEVENPTPGTPSERALDGIGLKNAAERLRLLFGGRASVELNLDKPNLATTRITIPVAPCGQ